MLIDLTDLNNNKTKEISIKQTINNIEKDKFKNTLIRDITKLDIDIKITKLYDSTYTLEGRIEGIMILPDDLTLENVSCPFSSDIEEKIEENKINDENKLDIFPILWQNIITEIPSKVIGNNRNIKKEGKNWKVISEEELESNRSFNSPFSNLQEILNQRKE